MKKLTFIVFVVLFFLVSLISAGAEINILHKSGKPMPEIHVVHTWTPVEIKVQVSDEIGAPIAEVNVFASYLGGEIQDNILKTNSRGIVTFSIRTAEKPTNADFIVVANGHETKSVEIATHNFCREKETYILWPSEFLSIDIVNNNKQYHIPFGFIRDITLRFIYEVGVFPEDLPITSSLFEGERVADWSGYFHLLVDGRRGAGYTREWIQIADEERIFIGIGILNQAITSAIAEAFGE